LARRRSSNDALALDNRRGSDLRRIRILATLATRIGLPQQIPAPIEFNGDLFDSRAVYPNLIYFNDADRGARFAALCRQNDNRMPPLITRPSRGAQASTVHRPSAA
jgi:hypothetical protein